MDLDKFIANLKKGNPHLMGGRQKGAPIGHAWLIVGYKSNSTGIYFWSNWGEDGIGNGWVYGNPYTTDKSFLNPETPAKVFSENLQHIYIN